MPTASVRGLNLNYEIVGDDGPWVALITGGRRGYREFVPMAEKLAANGFRVLLHDRRNTGSSDILLAGDEVEEATWADDLNELLGQFGAAPAFIGGSSSGAVDLPPELTAGSSHDLFVYHLPPMSLAKGHRAAVTVFRAEAPVREVYTWDLHLKRQDIESAPSGSGVATRTIATPVRSSTASTVPSITLRADSPSGRLRASRMSSARIPASARLSGGASR